MFIAVAKIRSPPRTGGPLGAFALELNSPGGALEQAAMSSPSADTPPTCNTRRRVTDCLSTPTDSSIT